MYVCAVCDVLSGVWCVDGLACVCVRACCRSATRSLCERASGARGCHNRNKRCRTRQVQCQCWRGVHASAVVCRVLRYSSPDSATLILPAAAWQCLDHGQRAAADPTEAPPSEDRGADQRGARLLDEVRHAVVPGDTRWRAPRAAVTTTRL